MPGVHLLVSGRVQGVGFRWFVRVTGRRLQLSGWVRNCPDGSVEIAAAGREDRLEELRRLVHEGPDGAVVTDVRELEPVAGDLDFPFGVRK
jgi:acylphosphatase